MRERSRFWRYAPLLPIAALQGALARRRIPLLPEAAGARTGTVHEGEGMPFRLAVLGESTAAGVGVEDQHDGLAAGLARVLARTEQRPVSFQIVGESGAAVRRVRALVERLAPPIDTVVVVIGVNDVLELTRGARWSAEVDGLVGDLRRRGLSDVVFSGVPPLGAFRSLPNPMRSILGARAAYLDALLHGVCLRTGARYAAVSFPDRPSLLSRDGFHPSAEGYATWAAALARALTGARRAP